MKTSQPFARTPESVARVRRFVRDNVKGVPADIAETAELMASELASNCVRHANVDFDVAVIRTSQEIRVEATDRSPGMPTPRSPGPTDPDGRGLQIISLLAAAWGVETVEGGGKTVWFSVTLPRIVPAYVPSGASGVPR